MKIKNYIRVSLPTEIKERNRVQKLRKKYHLDDSVKISGKLSVSGDFNCGEGCRFFSNKVSGNVKIGSYTSLNGPNLDEHSLIKPVAIGSFCSIARSVSF